MSHLGARGALSLHFSLSLPHAPSLYTILGNLLSLSVPQFPLLKYENDSIYFKGVISWFPTPSGTSQVELETGPRTWRVGRGDKKRRASPGW